MDLTDPTARLAGAWESLRWPWVLPVVGVVVLLALAWWALPPLRRRIGRDAVPVAHSARLEALPSYRRLRRRRLLLVGTRALGALLVVAGAGWLLARPTTEVADDEVSPSRDVILCLDASGVLDDVNAAVLRAAEDLVDERRGDRVGVVVFNGRPLTVLPLSDDYGAVEAGLDDVAEAFALEDATLLFAVQSFELRAAQVGDGLVSCIQRFDALDQERGRTVLLSTDNGPVGPPRYTLSEAGEYAERRDVSVHVLSPGDVRPQARTEIEGLADRTGGSLSELSGDGDARAAIDGIAAQEARRLDAPPRTRELDDPGPGGLACAAGAGLVLLTLAPGPGRRPGRRPADGAA